MAACSSSTAPRPAPQSPCSSSSAPRPAPKAPPSMLHGLPTRGYELIKTADQTKSFSILYYAIYRLMESDPTQTFQKVERYLRSQNGFFYLAAYGHPQDGTPVPKCPEGYQRAYNLYLCPKDSTYFKTQKLGESKGYQKNFERLADVGFSPIWLRDHEGTTCLPVKHLMSALDNLHGLLDAYLQSQQDHPRPSFSEHWDSLTLEQIRSELIPFQDAIGNVFRTLIFSHGLFGKMLEVGSGCMPVVELVPSLEGRVILSDKKERNLAYLKKNFPDSVLKPFDMMNPVGEKHRSYSSIVLNDILNSLDADELAKSARTLYNLLVPGGTVLSFSVRNSSQLPIFKELAREGYIYFPWVTDEERMNGVCAVKRDEFEAALEKLGPSHNMLKSALRLFAAWPEGFREYYCVDLYYQTSKCTVGMRNLIAGYSALAEGFNLLACPSLKQLDFDEEHVILAQKAMERVGFQTVVLEQHEGIYDREGIDERFHHPVWGIPNEYGIEGMAKYQRFNPELEECIVRQTAKVFVLVMKKP